MNCDKLLCYNDNIQYIFDQNIVEYDMVAASLSISERYKLIPQQEIDNMKLMTKENRTRLIGLRQRDDKIFSQQLLSGIVKTRQKFIDDNKLNDNNILVLHSDAVIFSSKKKIINNIEGVEFINKKSWTSYIRYNKVEIYYKNGCIDYKGIPQDMIKQHTLGLHKYFLKIFDMMENHDIDILSFLNKFQSDYLRDKLNEFYYIPFGKNGIYKMDNLSLLAYIANIVLNEVNTW